MAWGRALSTPLSFLDQILPADFFSEISKLFWRSKLTSIGSIRCPAKLIGSYKIFLGGAEDEYFSFFHSSCQLGLKTIPLKCWKSRFSMNSVFKIWFLEMIWLYILLVVQSTSLHTFFNYRIANWELLHALLLIFIKILAILIHQRTKSHFIVFYYYYCQLFLQRQIARSCTITLDFSINNTSK